MKIRKHWLWSVDRYGLVEAELKSRIEEMIDQSDDRKVKMAIQSLFTD